jgi:hypothetical protein
MERTIGNLFFGYLYKSVKGVGKEQRSRKAFVQGAYDEKGGNLTTYVRYSG